MTTSEVFHVTPHPGFPSLVSSLPEIVSVVAVSVGMKLGRAASEVVLTPPGPCMFRRAIGIQVTDEDVRSTPGEAVLEPTPSLVIAITAALPSLVWVSWPNEAFRSLCRHGGMVR